MTIEDGGTEPDQDGALSGRPVESFEAQRYEAQLQTLRHDALRDRDEILGLRSQISVLSERLAQVADGDLVKALERIDALEDEREALIDERHRTAISRRDELELLVNSFQRSVTWRVGSAVIRPASSAARQLRRLR